MKIIYLLVSFAFLFFISATQHSSSSNYHTPSHTRCSSREFASIAGVTSTDDYLLYGLTPDCQVFFIRPYQLPLLSKLRVNSNHPYCNANLAQLHVQSSTSLLLVFMQTGNRVCTLEVQIPNQQMIFGDHVFSYSLLASLPYASCSHSPRDSVKFLPDLSFMDTVYKDVIYFVDPRSKGEDWAAHQFKLSPDGFLKYLTKLNFTNYAKLKSTPASDYIVALDIQRKFLYKYNKQDNSLHYECSYDSLFRPEHVKSHEWNLADRSYGLTLNGLAAEKDLVVFSQTDTTIFPPVNKVYMRSTKDGGSQHHSCLGETHFNFDVGILRYSSLADMARTPLLTIPDKKPSAKYKPTKAPQHKPDSVTKEQHKEESHLLPTSKDPVNEEETDTNTVSSITQEESTTTLEHFEVEGEYEEEDKEPEEIGRILKTDNDEVSEHSGRKDLEEEERATEEATQLKGNASSLHNASNDTVAKTVYRRIETTITIIYSVVFTIFTIIIH